MDKDFGAKTNYRRLSLLSRRGLKPLSVVLLPIVFLSSGSANSQNEPKQTTNGRRLAMSLPKAARKAEAKQLSIKSPSIETTSNLPTVKKNNNQPRVSRSSVLPDNVRDVFLDSASKAELLSRSYNRHVADMIIWVASYMSQSGSYTPAGGPVIKRQAPVESRPQEDGVILQID